MPAAAIPYLIGRADLRGLREHALRLEHRAIDAGALHRPAGAGAHFDRAARAAAHCAGHVLLERNLAGQREFPRQRRGSTAAAHPIPNRYNQTSCEGMTQTGMVPIMASGRIISGW